MNHIEFDDIQMPGIRNISRPGTELDQIRIRSNIWLKIQNKLIKSDQVYIPIEFELNFEAKIRRGIRMKYGWTQDVKSNFNNVSLILKECQIINSEHQIYNQMHKQPITERNFKLSPLQELLCSNIDVLNEYLNAQYHDMLESKIRMKDTVFDQYEEFWGKYAEWYPFPEMQ